MTQYFPYGPEAMEHLKAKDARLGVHIDRIGHINRPINPDLFSALIHAVVGQQISTKAHQTVWGRLVEALGEITAESVDQASVELIQGQGLSFRKVHYLKEIAARVIHGEIRLEIIKDLSDAAAMAELTKFRGVGIWSAEMLLIFSLARPDIFSFDDLAIQRGLKILLGLDKNQKLDRAFLTERRKLYSPFGSIASLYLWAIAVGA
ncbi:MAG: DNA-3-methyladenine glycosylase 2 family protein [Deltaproteobacteria bacterium]|jgi:DNA-3-methyladenine glycosylase II|nr:DNA-3-methyladenine glycosylase 2 family protein [Deltaproteobacteria bacterium]